MFMMLSQVFYAFDDELAANSVRKQIQDGLGYGIITKQLFARYCFVENIHLVLYASIQLDTGGEHG